MALSEAQQEALASWIAGRLHADLVEIERCERLAGGAIQENLALDLKIEGGDRPGRHALVLRTDATSRVAESWGRAEEFRILEVAHGAGVLVPEPWLLCEDPAVIGGIFYLMGRVGGEARGTRLVRDPALRESGDALVGALADQIARLHRLTPPVAALSFMTMPGQRPTAGRIAELRRHLDAMGEVQPVIEWGLRWLERHLPATEPVRLIHADFRTGNYMVEKGRLTALLDWEFARYGNPLEDLGWFLARCWRYGQWEREAGGIGSRAAFLDAYETGAGHRIERAQIPLFELLATLRWAVIALMQARRHYSGAERSLELALTLHVVPTLEQDILAYVEAIERGQAA